MMPSGGPRSQHLGALPPLEAGRPDGSVLPVMIFSWTTNKEIFGEKCLDRHSII